ncbi:hypothetical protein FH972_024921 [Carpinus fangiana]|uniref:Serine/threonine-protein phosphatase n=1 Tax=Carpinus fangiana TaxID=176857 RepID=A0A5N6KZV3_9ROSI|nr:hypothetical protein FH972_024921 [Carpinus fangiana]
MASGEKQNIVVTGGGIIGCTSAYYLSRHPFFSASTHTITLLEASSIAGGASGKAGGLLAKWAYPRQIVDLSFNEHAALAKQHGGETRWGYRRLDCGQVDAKVRPTAPTTNSNQTNGTGDSDAAHVSLKKRDPDALKKLKRAGFPTNLDWVDAGAAKSYNAMGTADTTAQVHPYQFTNAMAELARDAGVEIITGAHVDTIAATPTSGASTHKKQVESVTYTRDGTQHTLPATHVVLAAGPWTRSLYARAPISGLRAHSVVIKPRREISAYALFMEIAHGKGVSTPEIYARPFGEVYACGEGDTLVPLPSSTVDVEVDQQRCEDIISQVGSISEELRDGEVAARQACYLPVVDGPGGPYIGETADIKGLVLASGHSCWGIQNGPGTEIAIQPIKDSVARRSAWRRTWLPMIARQGGTKGGGLVGLHGLFLAQATFRPVEPQSHVSPLLLSFSLDGIQARTRDSLWIEQCTHDCTSRSNPGPHPQVTSSSPAMGAKEDAVALKDKGNKAFKEHNWDEAIDWYSQAIDTYDQEPTFFTNRAQVYIKTEAYGFAVNDATKAIEIDPNSVKAYYRRACANTAILKHSDALRDWKIVVQKNPSDKGAMRQRDEVKKIVQRDAFFKAIDVGDQPSAAEGLDLDSMAVEEDYDGARLGKEMTQEFIDDMIERFRTGKKIHRKYLYQIVLAVKDISYAEPTMVEMTVPEGDKLTVCGDTHGQFFDLLEIFRLNGYPSDNHAYLFNGDFVDRGSWSTEVALLLYSYKWLRPNKFFLNRGNHEADDMNRVYGFEGECTAKYSAERVFKLFSESFSALPLATLIGAKFLVLHGGLFSDDKVTLDDIRKLDRHAQRQPGQSGLMMEMLWTDPQPQPGRGPSKRGVGMQFGPDITKRFCDANGLDAVIRSHEVRMDGYAAEHNEKCITVFSAPNYCDSTGNKGAYINIEHDYKLQYNQFEAVEHPDIKPMAYARNSPLSSMM